jgi:hypothetical protein
LEQERRSWSQRPGYQLIRSAADHFTMVSELVTELGS